MNNNKVLPIVQGAMIASLYGVFSLLNTYTGSTFDIILSYIMVMPMLWYASEYSIKYTLSLYITSAVVVFIMGQLMFWSFSIPTLLLGVFYGIYQKHKGKHMFIGLVITSAIKNSISFFIFGGMTGISVWQEGKEMYQMIIEFLPFLENIINVEISFIIMWILIFICEAYCIMMYGNLFLKRIIKKK
ncbi:MAG: DUF2232 domain-containing protein [Coprobacillaceae bacterium]